MQTFLPYKDFKECAKVLDYKRLGKQRVEAKQIFDCIYYQNRWKNHPTVKMWIGYEGALALYHNEMISEWIRRGYNNNMPYIVYKDTINFPWWLGYEDFHKAMRSRLIQKYPEYYLLHFNDDKGFNDSKYLWPINETKSFKIID